MPMISKSRFVRKSHNGLPKKVRKFQSFRFRGTVEGLEARQLLAADPVISEFVAFNTSTIQDENGEYSDWIEIQNRGDTAANLSNYYLTDDEGNLAKWQFPAGTIVESGDFLMVFASGKDRAVPGNELHTNFTINELGGDLALVAPDGSTVISSFFDFAPVGEDQAHALIRQSEDATYLTDGSPVRVLVPANNDLGTTWRGGNEPFADGAANGWLQGTGAVGYDTSQAANSFRVEVYYSTVEINNLAGSLSAIAGNNLRAGSPVVADHQTVNFLDPGGGGVPGNFTGDVPFPGDTGADDNDFVMRATTTFVITSDQAGMWTFGFNSDDGGRLRIDGSDVIVDDIVHAPENRFGTINLTAGQHQLEYIFFERGGGAEAELWAARGNHSAFDPALFSLVGDPNGNLPLSNLDDLVDTDLEAQMLNQNASVYLRYPFAVADAESVTSLLLDLQIDDGAVVYLNGTQIFSHQAPASPAFNSTALSESGLTRHRLDLVDHLDLLVDGSNILAIHGLNAGAADTEYLVDVSLAGRVLGPVTPQVVSVPTPGAQNGFVAPVITEFQADNSSTIEDEDGDNSDWIEIHNPGTVDYSIHNWYLTDDRSELTKWRFPATIIPAGGYLVVFASSKNKGGMGQELHTNFALSREGEYLALVEADGSTIRWEYEPGGQNFPVQFADVSYGLRGADSSIGEEDLDPVRGLVAYWDFEDGAGSSTAADRSGNGIVATLTDMDPATDWVQGRDASSTALVFDGTNDHVLTDATATDLGFPGGTQRTIAGWVQSPALTPLTLGGVFQIGQNDGSLALRNNTLGANFVVEHSATPGSGVTFVSGASTWFHFAVTYDGQTVKVYRNGTLAGEVENLDLNTNDLLPLTMGRWIDAAGNSRFFRGHIDELAVWDMALPAATIAGLADESLSPLTAPTVNRPIGVTRDAFTVRQVNASATFAGQVPGQVGGGANPLADADLLLSLSGGHPGVAGEATFGYDTINFHDDAGLGSNGTFGLDEPFPLDDFIGDDDHFALRATATLVVPEGEAGEFLFAVHSDDGSRLRINGTNVILDNARHTAELRTGTITLGEGEHTLELVYFEHTGGATVELLYASMTGGLQDGDLELLTIAQELQTPQVPPTVFAAERVYFPEPTPGGPNSFGAEQFVGATMFSVPHGFYDAPVQLELSTETVGAQIYYTTNGTEPSPTNGTLYDEPITISSTTAVRARAFLDNATPSAVVSSTYLFIDDILTQSPTGAAPPGFPTSWGSNAVDYGMDPDIVNSPVWGPQMEAALTQIPTMSMVLDLNDLFGTQGIYSNAGNRGRQWERPTSIELIYPEGYVRPDGTVPTDSGFQENAGVRIRGGFSRSADNPKHAFRLFFRKEYGDSQLRYPLFGEEGAQEFDKFDLRTTQNYSWAYLSDSRNNFLRDVFSRDLMQEFGQPTTRSDYYHLYINGHYWGLFQTEERPGADYAAENLGGVAEDWDVVHNDIGQRQLGAIDGTMDSSERLWNEFIKPGGLSDSNLADYYRVQGMNPDGTRNPSFERMLDVDNLIDYMITTYYTSDADGPGSKFTRPQLNNYYAVYNRENPDGWKFLEHDSEHSLDTGNGANANFNMVSPLLNNGTNLLLFNPHWMHEQLANSNSDYRQRFIDRVTEVFDPETGILSPDNVKNMLQTRADQFDLAIIAESARWGDRSGTLLTKTHWETAVQNTLNWVTNRQEELLNQLRCAGGDTARNPNPDTCTPTIMPWYPNFEAPTATPGGGNIDDSVEVELTVPGQPVFDQQTLITSDNIRYLIPTAADHAAIGLNWKNVGFNNFANWTVGQGDVGYETGTGYEAFIHSPVPAGTTSVYILPTTTFDVVDTDGDGMVNDEFASLELRARYDDGFVAYLNGALIASVNAPTVPSFNSVATAQHDDGAAVNLESIPLPPSALNRLRPTGNVLAVHALNINSTSTDFLMGFELLGQSFAGLEPGSAQIFYTLDGTDPRASGNGPSSSAIAYNAVETLIDAGATGKFHIPTGAGGESGWQGGTPGFDDSGWMSVTSPIGYDTGVIQIVPGFSFRVLDVAANFGSIAAATAALDGNLGGVTVVNDTTMTQPYVNHGDPGNLTTPPVLTMFGTDRETYAVRATANVTIPVGQWTLAAGSDDGVRVTVPGVTFQSSFNENGNNAVGTNTFAYSAPRGHAQTGAAFTVSGQPLTTTIIVDFYEDGGGDSLELTLAPGLKSAFDGTFAVLQNNLNGWQISTTDQNIDFDPLITTDVETQMLGVNSSAYLRFPFQATNVDDIIHMGLELLYDDGYVAYLNGVEVARRSAPLNVQFNSAATASRADSQIERPDVVDIGDFVEHLNDGANVLAIQLLNASANDPDALIAPMLKVTYDGAPFTITGNTLLRTRSFEDGLWSPLVEEFYQVTQPTVAITEINYNPYDPTEAELSQNAGWDNDDFEFVEIQNSGSEAIELAGVQFTNGISFTFGAATLAPGERGVVVKNPQAYDLRYPNAPAPLGTFTGSLDNSGERLALADGLGVPLLDFTYSDAAPWALVADGDGATLELISPTTDPQLYDKPYSWRASTNYGGSPGTAGAAPIGVVVNEVLTHTDSSAAQVRPGAVLDSIELHNTTSAPISIGGWYLSDSSGAFLKYQIPVGTVLPAGGYMLFDESDFNPSMGADPANHPNDFALNASEGDDVYLVIPGGPAGVQFIADAVDFGAAAIGESFGRVPDGSGRLAPMARQTFGSINTDPRVGPVVISELHYNPGEPTAADLAIEPNLTSNDLEFIEIHNPTTSAVDLTNWRIRGGADLDFANGTSIPAGGTLVVLSFDPEDAINANRLAAFRARYGMDGSEQLIGPYAGQLSNDGERVQLQRPDVPPANDPTTTPYLYEDEILYDTRVPWSSEADGGGSSLQRRTPVLFGNAAGSWNATAPTPGSVQFTGIAGDFDGDGAVGARDIDILFDAVVANRQVSYMDLDGSGEVARNDVSFLVEDVLGSLFGDANLDHTVDASDLNIWNTHRFQNLNTTWLQADFNGDGRTDGRDFNIWNVNKFRSAGAAAAATGRTPRAAAVSDAALAIYVGTPELDRLPISERASHERGAQESNPRDTLRVERLRENLVRRGIVFDTGARRDEWSSVRRYVQRDSAQHDDREADFHEGLDVLFESWGESPFAPRK